MDALVQCTFDVVLTLYISHFSALRALCVVEDSEVFIYRLIIINCSPLSWLYSLSRPKYFYYRRYEFSLLNHAGGWNIVMETKNAIKIFNPVRQLSRQCHQVGLLSGPSQFPVRTQLWESENWRYWILQTVPWNLLHEWKEFVSWQMQGDSVAPPIQCLEYHITLKSDISVSL